MKSLVVTAALAALAAFFSVTAHADPTFTPQVSLVTPTNGETFQITEQKPSGLWLAIVPVQVVNQYIQVTGTPGSTVYVSWNMSITYSEGGPTYAIGQDSQSLPRAEVLKDGTYKRWASYSSTTSPGQTNASLATPKPCSYTIVALSSITDNGSDPIPQSFTSTVQCVGGPNG